MVVPTSVKQALSGDPITVYRDGRQTRCFCDVRDVVRALARLVTQEAAVGVVVNVGSNEEVSIQELAERVKSITGSTSPIVEIPYSVAYGVQFADMRRRVPDTERVRSLIGWEPTVDLKGILKRIADHMKADNRVAQ
jgi:UDP-glucose 4-epimerase